MESRDDRRLRQTSSAVVYVAEGAGVEVEHSSTPFSNVSAFSRVSVASRRVSPFRIPLVSPRNNDPFRGTFSPRTVTPTNFDRSTDDRAVALRLTFYS